MSTQISSIANLLNQGIQQHQNGDLIGAEAYYQQALTVEPNQPDALHLLGLILDQQGRTDDAIDWIQRAIQADPTAPVYFLNLGNTLRRSGRYHEAVSAYRRAIDLADNFVEAWANLGAVQLLQQDWINAQRALTRAIQIKPQFLDAYNNLAIAYLKQGNLTAAIELLEQAVQSWPDNVMLLITLGATYKEQGNLNMAFEVFNKALLQNPNHPDALNNLSVVSKLRGSILDAIDLYRRVIELRPKDATSHYNLANAMRDAGEISGALVAYKKAIELKPDYEIAYSNLLFTLNHSVEVAPEAIYHAHKQFNTVLGQYLYPEKTPVMVRVNRPQKLKIAYVSADFRHHPIGYFMMPLLANHDKDRFEIWCYHNYHHSDDWAAKLKACADNWVECVNLTDEQLAVNIQQQNIHILVDLSGHTAGNRLRLFARKPAPIQVSYLGYANTTGLNEIDYRIADEVTEPQIEGDRNSSEKIWRIPDSYFCFQPPQSDIPISELPSRRNGYITFGYTGSHAKITPTTLENWGHVLLALPSSRIVIRTKSLGDQRLAERLMMYFLRQGVSTDRVELHGWAERSNYLAGFHAIDILLDAFPFNLATNTLEALWMGVPIITQAGQTHASRMGASILKSLGLDDFIAKTSAGYVKKAIYWANRQNDLVKLRSTLRNKLQASPLMSGREHAKKIEAAYDAIWSEYQKSQSPK